MKMAIVSYYYRPYKGVGAFRAIYWSENITKIDSNITCDVITAMENVPENFLGKDAKVISVPDNHSSIIFSFLRLDSGITWRRSLEKYFKEKNDKYDILIFTGGPFLHFFVAKQLKKKMNCNIIFDFRDPFANNPYYKNNPLKSLIKKYLERKMLRISDLNITVNSYCKDLMEKNDNTIVEIIENGYDDKVIKNISNKMNNKKHKFGYAGKFYSGVFPDNFLKVISESPYLNRCEFDYMGESCSYIESFNKGNVMATQTVPYKEAIERVAQFDTALLFTGGQPFQSTTKVFDYIGLEKNILIITNGEPRTGNLYEITKDYPNVFWAHNSENDIRNVLEKAMEHKPKPYPEKEKFSRDAGLRKLVNIINSLYVGKK
ncbi:MAG: glycosyltransferase [bacterium]